jgi:hypothetical protein
LKYIGYADGRHIRSDVFQWAVTGQNVSYFVMGVVLLEAASEVNNSNKYGHLKLLLLLDDSPEG